MIHLGDITKINGAEIPIVDVITGGSPCQDLSVAGNRAGLAGERSGLFMEQIRIVKEMREHDRRANKRTSFMVRPRYMVWENVAGAFSSGKPKGADFQAVLTEIARVADPECPDVPLPEKGWSKSGCIYDELGRFSIAWRVHDAQFWGVPQRRKRISLVADFGGESAPEILFERKGLSGDIATSGKERQGIAENASGSVGEAGATFYDAYQHHGWRESDTSGTLTAGQNNSVRGDTPLIAEDMKAIGFNRERCGAVAMDDAMPTLQAAAGESHSQGFAMQAIGEYKDCECASSLKQRDYKDATDLVVGSFYPQMKAESQCYSEGPASVVRRLTPLECERLQGYPDNWTNIGDWIDSKGKKHKGDADSPRYKALGNSIALPFWFYLLRRISAQYERPATLGSLFDGIGGFPLCWARCNGSDSVLWGSEIEEFPMAVVKKHFGDGETPGDIQRYL